MIVNINYKGHISPSDLAKLKISPNRSPPQQKVIDFDNGRLLVFSSGKCRLMGVRYPLESDHVLPMMINDLQIQSITVVGDLGHDINLLTLAHRIPCNQRMFEPELFPALRLTKYKPLCVNVFASGKVVVLGLRELAYQEFLSQILDELRKYINN